MLIQDKKLDKSVEEERKNLYASTKGQELLTGAQELQNEVQGIADKAMLEAKREKGTTGMDFNELGNVMDQFSEHSFKPAVGMWASKTSSAVTRYVVRNGRLECVHEPPPLK